MRFRALILFVLATTCSYGHLSAQNLFQDYFANVPRCYSPHDPWITGKIFYTEIGHGGFAYNCDCEECKRQSPYITWQCQPLQCRPNRPVRRYIINQFDEIKQRIRWGNCCNDACGGSCSGGCSSGGCSGAVGCDSYVETSQSGNATAVAEWNSRPAGTQDNYKLSKDLWKTQRPSEIAAMLQNDDDGENSGNTTPARDSRTMATEYLAKAQTSIASPSSPSTPTTSSKTGQGNQGLIYRLVNRKPETLNKSMALPKRPATTSTDAIEYEIREMAPPIPTSIESASGSSRKGLLSRMNLNVPKLKAPSLKLPSFGTRRDATLPTPPRQATLPSSDTDGSFKMLR